MTNLTGVCQYSTPCGWCTKWDKKCDSKIDYKKDKELEDIKNGKGIPKFKEPWISNIP